TCTPAAASSRAPTPPKSSTRPPPSCAPCCSPWASTGRCDPVEPLAALEALRAALPARHPPPPSTEAPARRDRPDPTRAQKEPAAMRDGCTPWPPEFAERYRAAGYWTGETFGAFLRDRARRFADRTAVVGGDRRWTYAELDARADRLATGLHRLG